MVGTVLRAIVPDASSARGASEPATHLLNTPAHAVASLLLLGDEKRPETGLPLVIGALLPDVPIVVFYAYQKLWRGMPEDWIWSQGYRLAGWQAFFEVFNSLPLILIGLLAARAAGSIRLGAVFASMGVHVVFDLPLHHDDGHRHLFPISDWRFESPVSYWDPTHYGLYVAPLEALLVVAGGWFLIRRSPARSLRLAIAALVGFYAVYWIYVVVVWL